MKITSKGRYGLKAMLELSKDYQSGLLVKSREIAQRQEIPLKYLEQIIAVLRKSSLLVSVRGPDGGYRLARSPENITIYEVLRTLEGDLSIMDLSGLGKKNDEVSGQNQGLFWHELEKKIKDFLEIPLADFAVSNKNPEQDLMYYI